MRPVNLLPPSARPYQASGKSGGAYVVVGVLAALVLAMGAYVLTANQITSRQNAIQTAQQAASAARAKAAGLEKYAEFTQVASARVSAVGSLATNRIDYERILRETARVLPSGVWLNELDADATGSDSSTSASAGTTSSTPTTGTSNPTVHLLGCAPSQNAVAVTLVRLRAIHGSGDVQLNDSGRPLKNGASGGGQAGGTSCGTSRYAFDILVTLTPQVTGYGDLGQKVPSSLGGGS